MTPKGSITRLTCCCRASSHSQLGFWPLPAVAPVPRGFRADNWFLGMLVDQTRNEAYRQAINR
jgi:hypothetical protein